MQLYCYYADILLASPEVAAPNPLILNEAEDSQSTIQYVSDSCALSLSQSDIHIPGTEMQLVDITTYNDLNSHTSTSPKDASCF
ncbi:hypothetical protein EBR66_05435 [bacterium]|nr:hypothetical protein [bacterium]